MFSQRDIDRQTERLIEEWERLLVSYHATATDDQLRVLAFFLCHKMAALQVVTGEILNIEEYYAPDDEPPPTIMN